MIPPAPSANLKLCKGEKMTELYDNGISDNHNVLCPKCKTVTDYREYLDAPGGYLEKRVCVNCGNTFKYPGGDSLYDRHVYEAKCDGHKLMVLTQDDDNPEYYTTVTVICPIHNKEVVYGLPVN